MVTVKAIIFSFLFTAAICAPLKGNEESVTLFHGEDFHILLSSLEIEVSFKNRSDPRKPLMLMRGRKEINSRATLNEGSSHLIIENVGEGDEGLYIVKNPKNPDDIKQYSLIVRDCTREQVIKYGGSFSIPLQGVNPPIILEYRPSAVEANQTSGPAFVLLTAAGSLTEPYQERINVSERYVTLRGVTGADEGSYTVRDNKGFIQKKVCLNVIEHAKHVTLVYGEKLKINLILNSSLVQLFYTPSTIGSSTHLLLDKGEFTSALTELKLEDRLSLEGSVVILDQAKDKDSGLFKITDLRGFTVSTIQLRLEPRKLEPLFVAIIAMLGLLTFLLLACLLSCLIKVNKRAKRAAALEKLAQNAGKEDEGEAFRQVVKNITKLSEESKHSQADNTEKSQSTEVDIKGLEVSSKEVGGGNLETSDSGVGFNTALPLDTDTDAPDQIPDSEAASISVPPETKPSPPSAPESKPAASPATEVKPSSVPETKVSPVPETKKTPDQLKKEKLDAPKPADSKGSSSPSPEPKTGLSPADPKPASSPSPEPKVPPATTPTPESKSTSTPTKDPAKPTSAEPITNGTPEPGPDAKASPDHADIIKGSAPKEVSPKTHEVELKSSVSEGHKDGSAAEDSTTT
ncbi:SH3 domain-binding protein 1 [Kryptolebias marmoratus]|uniref:Si:dkeyp-77h1.4 n=1 Tax=Kryptolebias marmoratus TaxID=37003 RepID=A0A3Q3AM19_KRYMA|nr:SH3 domain-binding protein 1 [Kryptolebias marmoratus]XP_017270876.1 SH3 domain-binding protein 1 [Kryptolebias marmoratus]